MQGIEDLGQMVVVLAQPLSHLALYFVKALLEDRGVSHPAQREERPHDLNVHGNRSVAAKDARESIATPCSVKT
jgi:hypothetical protein